MDIDRASLPLRLTIFENENPDLFRTLSALPPGRIARRTALMRLLELGVRAARSEVVPSEAAVSEKALAPVVSAPSPGAPAPAQNALSTPLPDVQIDEADLMEVFS